MISVPLRFERIFLEKVWGGRRLATTPGLELPAGIAVGETWELVDRASENSVVAVGPHRGRTLRELMAEESRSILGEDMPGPGGNFPLLVKYIDASAALSIQVHPDDEAAARVGGGAEAKTEAWYVLAVEPGAAIWSGLKPGVTREEFAAHVGEEGLDELLQSWEVQPGDCVTLLGGTVHAIGAGITLLEVQQSSDTTYRLWDWGRVGLDGKPRETHVEQALDVISFGRRAHPPVRGSRQAVGESVSRARQSQTDSFSLDSLEVRGAAKLSTRGRFEVLVVIEGAGRLESVADGEAVELRRGDTWLLPAALGEYRLGSKGDSITLVSLTGGPR